MAFRTLFRQRLQPSCFNMLRPMSQDPGLQKHSLSNTSIAFTTFRTGLPFRLGKVNHVAIAVPDLGQCLALCALLVLSSLPVHSQGS
jgi:hypothetical protein